ncbi:MAG: 23S rRNA (adenine(2030)-N(6))-methyltransferase RlmJ [Burkholderiales bacterium]|nr:23S rRNA (adenine(2030)-N(6))-methyltransferase RlmJ [Opitutaceae bacterium]
MNYRHQYHAGNFADVLKHAVLLHLLGALQAKDKGILYLDTHSGRGGYDLAAAASGQTKTREPEWPNGQRKLLGSVLRLHCIGPLSGISVIQIAEY